MPQIQGISLRTLPGLVKGTRRNCVSMGWRFTGDTPAPQSIGPWNFTGSSFSLDISELSNAAAGIGEIKSLSFFARFWQSQGQNTLFTYDGAISIFSPSSGQFAQVGMQSEALNSGSIAGGGTTESGIVSGVIPIIAAAPTVLLFGKSVAQDNNLHGSLFVTAYDFDVTPWNNQGICAS